jgi:hypothetical protein
MGNKTQKLSNVVDQIVEWQAVVTADGSTGLTAVAGRGYFIDTTSGAITVTLPASPKIGDTIGIIDYANTFGINNVTLDRNGNNIKGSASNEILSSNNGANTFVYIDNTQGWKKSTTTDDSPTFITATGGTVTTSGNFKTHIFTGDGCFVVSSLGNPSGGPNSVDYLIVAGGGGSGRTGGGGGAGGFRSFSSLPVASPLNASAIPLSVQTYPISIGGGGIGGTTDSTVQPATTGTPSTALGLTSAGGGGGANYNSPTGALLGGSGGGAGPAPAGSSGGNGNTPPVVPPQGNNGGTQAGGPVRAFGGGGGAGAAGTPGTANAGACGGVGSYIADSFIGPTAPSYGEAGPVSAVRYFSGGGAGGRACGPATAVVGGFGGGGNGGNNPCGPNLETGDINTGGGAGSQNNINGSAGGSGIVIIRYKFQ